MLALIVGQPGVRRVILFGSAAQDRMDEHSDLDLCIVQDTALRFYDRLAWWLRRLRPRVGLDLVVYTPGEMDQLATREGFVRTEIEQRGREIYAA